MPEDTPAIGSAPDAGELEGDLEALGGLLMDDDKGAEGERKSAEGEIPPGEKEDKEVEEKVEGEEEPEEGEERLTKEEEALSKLIDEELEGEEDEDLKEFLKTSSPEYKDIVKKYPEFFKNFPSMRHIFFRMREMDRMFSSVDEAKEVVERHDNLTDLEQSIMAGKADKLLDGVKTADERSFTRFAEDLLPQLYQLDRPVYNRVVYPVFVNALREASRAAEEHGNENLGKAANWMAYFLFGKKSVAELPTKSAQDPEIEAERRALAERENRMVSAESQRFEGESKSTGENLLRREVLRGLDPDGVLPEFVRDAIVQRVMQRVGEMMEKDDRHLAQMNALWKRAQSTGFSREAKARLVSAWFGRARVLVGPIRRQLVRDAVSKGRRSGTTTPQKGKVIPSGGAPRREGGKPLDAKKIDWVRTSDSDFMAGKITYRK